MATNDNDKDKELRPAEPWKAPEGHDMCGYCGNDNGPIVPGKTKPGHGIWREGYNCWRCQGN